MEAPNQRGSAVPLFAALAVIVLFGAVALGVAWFTTTPEKNPAEADPKPGSPSDDSRTRIHWNTSPTSQAQAREAMHWAAQYIVRACRENGRFVYEIHLDDGQESSTRYNVLRHAGAMYALGMYNDRFPDDEVRDALLRAGRYLRENCVGPLKDRDDVLAVWTTPEVTGGKSREAKLGGAGLGLLALTAVEKIQPGFTPRDELRKLAEFILFMQKSDGSFYSMYYPESGRDDEWDSLYYPGEAALGLLMFYGIDSDPRWLQSAAEAMAFLARSRVDVPVTPPDHWMLLATAQLLPIYDRCEPPVPRTHLVRNARRTCLDIMAQQRFQRDNPTISGCYVSDGRTCPTSTRMEGLLAAMTFLSHRDSARDRVQDSVQQGMAFLIRSQVRQGEHRGAIPLAIDKLPPEHPEHSESFNRTVGEVRIDYVQHALSAMLQYDDVFWPDSE